MRAPRRLSSAATAIDMGSVSYLVLPIVYPTNMAKACTLGRLTIKAAARVGNVSCQAYLARDAAGLYAINEPGAAKNFTTPTGITATGAVVYDLNNLPYDPDEGASEGLYVVVALNAGTATLTAIVDVFQS